MRSWVVIHAAVKALFSRNLLQGWAGDQGGSQNTVGEKGVEVKGGQ